MKKKALAVLLAAMTVAATTSCGESKIENTAAVESSIEFMEDTGLIVEELPTVEPIYTEYEDLFIAENFYELNKGQLEAVDVDNLEEMFVQYVLSDSVDLYNYEGTWNGYSKPNVEVTLFGMNDEWAEVSFANTVLYVPKDIFEAKATLAIEEPETENISDILLAEEELPKQEETSKSAETTPATKPKETTPVTTVTPEPVTPEPEPTVDNTKYTPEEAIAVYRSIMEANGIIWDPSIKDFASWGTGWINLEKGQPEETGNSSASVFREGGGDITRPWTRYYLEVTGSDANAVYITAWHCD